MMNRYKKPMKRIFSLLLAALLLTSFLSCAAPKEGSDPAPTGAGSSETEANNKTFIVQDRQCTFADMIVSPMFESEDSVYYCAGARTRKIYFSDKENKDWMPLCFKPNCLHRGSDCNAQLEGENSYRIWPYGEYIYYVAYDRYSSGSSPKLWRMKLDGSDHEFVLVFNYTKEVDVYDEYTWDFVFHNKYLYAWLCASNPDLRKTERGFETLIFLVDLSCDKPKAELTDLVYETGLPVCGRGDTVYCFNTLNNNSITKVDLVKGTQEKLCELPYYPDVGLVLKGDRLYVTYNQYDHQFDYIDANTGETTHIMPLEVKVKYKLTDDYLIGTDKKPKGTVASSTDDKKGTLIYDYEGNLVQQIPYEKYNRNIMAEFSSGDYVFGYDTDMKDNSALPPEWYLDLREIGSPDMTWHKWAPED